MANAAQIAAVAATLGSKTLPPSPPFSALDTIQIPRFMSPLPTPRRKELPDAKMAQSRHWLDDRIRSIGRRFIARLGVAPDAPTGETTPWDAAYGDIGEVCRDIDKVVNFCWLTATPAISVPFLFTVADDFPTYIAGFPRMATPTFQIFHKLDHCFASMLQGLDIVTGEPFTGPQARPFLSTTDAVRLKSILERTRHGVMNLFYEDEERGGEDSYDEDDDMVDVTPGKRDGGGEYDDDEDEDDVLGSRAARGDGNGNGGRGGAGKMTPGLSDLDDAEDTDAEDDILFGAEPVEEKWRGRRWDDEEGEWLGMEVGSVYENSLVEIGRTLRAGRRDDAGVLVEGGGLGWSVEDLGAGGGFVCGGFVEE